MQIRHHIKRRAYASVWRDGDRIDDYATFAFFDAADLFDLALYVHIFMYDANTAQARHHDRRAVLGDGVHRSRYDRDI